jgi:hypothetical protein
VGGVIDTDSDGIGDWHFGVEFPVESLLAQGVEPNTARRALPEWEASRVSASITITPGRDGAVEMLFLELVDGSGHRLELKGGPMLPRMFQNDGISLSASGDFNFFIGTNNFPMQGAKHLMSPEYWSPTIETDRVDGKTTCDSGGPGARECSNSNCNEKRCTGCAGVSCKLGYYACCTNMGECGCVESHYGEPICKQNPAEIQTH